VINDSVFHYFPVHRMQTVDTSISLILQLCILAYFPKAKGSISIESRQCVQTSMNIYMQGPVICWKHTTRAFYFF